MRTTVTRLVFEQRPKRCSYFNTYMFMIDLIKKIFKKKEEVEAKEVNTFLLDRPLDRILLSDYYSNRFDDNQFYRLNIEMGLVVPINLSNNKEFENYINENYLALKEVMELKGRNFVYDLQIPDNLDLHYYFPFVNDLSTNFFTQTNNNSLLEFIGYKGNITTGFLSFISGRIVFVGLKENESINCFASAYISNLSIDLPSNNIFYSLGKPNEDEEPNIEIDDETKLMLKQIEDNLIKLKQSGQFFLVAPQLEKLIYYVHKQNNDTIGISLSDIIIDDEFRILLPRYKNTEIKLSHLTKAVYLLFLKHPEGILLSELFKYETELLLIYQAISYQDSLDKMKNSVRELITNDKAIFVHFSRIKSAFVKNFTDYYAKFYYIQGNKGDKKYIKLPTENIVFKIKI